MTASTWKDVWERRTFDTGGRSVLAAMLAADGMDTPFGAMAEDAWRDYVRRTASTLGISTGSSVFEVGCGSGAYLYELRRLGCSVAGIDASSKLVGYSRDVLPDAELTCDEALALDPAQPYEFVISNAVFLYFPSADYARRVLERMVRKARKGIMVLDVPDLAKRDEALALRRKLAGEETYDREYAGLDHLYLAKKWFEETLRSLGLWEIRIEDQSIDGYVNSRYRYNVFAKV